jgi:hypothetical protein
MLNKNPISLLCHTRKLGPVLVASIYSCHVCGSLQEWPSLQPPFSGAATAFAVIYWTTSLSYKSLPQQLLFC